MDRYSTIHYLSTGRACINPCVILSKRYTTQVHGRDYLVLQDNFWHWRLPTAKIDARRTTHDARRTLTVAMPVDVVLGHGLVAGELGKIGPGGAESKVSGACGGALCHTRD